MKKWLRYLLGKRAVLVIVGLQLAGFSLNAQPVAGRTKAQIDQEIALLIRAGKFQDAIIPARQALDLLETNKPQSLPDIAAALNTLAMLLVRTESFDEAERFSRRSLSIAESLFGENDSRVATSLNNLATLLLYKGQPKEAEPLLQRSLSIKERLVGADDPQLINPLNNLAGVLMDIGDSSSTETILLRSLKISENAPSDFMPARLATLQNLATLYHESGDYFQAELFFDRALKILREPKTEDKSALGNVLLGLASVNTSIGVYDKAEALSLEALAIVESTSGKETPEVAAVLNNLGMIRLQQRKYSEAQTALLRSSEIRKRELGPGHPDSITSLNNLAVVHFQKGEFSDAEKLQKTVLENTVRHFGEDHLVTAVSLNTLATFKAQRGELSQAESLFTKSLNICEKMGKSNHPTATDALGSLALLNFELKKTKTALDYSHRYKDNLCAEYRRTLAFSSERQTLSYQALQRPYDILATLGNALGLAEMILRTKALALDSISDDLRTARASGDRQIKDLVAERQRLARRVLQIEQETTRIKKIEGVNPLQTEEEELTQRIESIQKALMLSTIGPRVSEIALKIEVSDVERAIRPGSILLEFVRYQHYVDHSASEWRYGVILMGPSGETLPGARAGEPLWMPVGAASDIEKNIDIYVSALRRGRKGDEAIFRKLYSQIFSPIKAVIPKDCHTLIIAPDFQLSFLNFGVLLSEDGKFLAEDFDVKYVTCGRDLLGKTGKLKATRELIVFANPDYANSLPPTKQTTTRSAQSPLSEDRSAYDSLQFVSLPGTELEASILKQVALKWNLPFKLFLGREANEASINELGSPLILHFATHGFFLKVPAHNDDLRNLQTFGGRRSEYLPNNPMQRSGLALAGGQKTIDSWKRGEFRSTENDGILTAAEVCDLNLKDTWLVVLSACDSGLGESRTGEGVFGLRRAFAQAGAENLLLTLSTVSDKWSVEIMKAFYEKALRHGDASQAMADVQAEWLKRLKKEKGLLLAARIVGPFILTSRGSAAP